LLFSLYLPLNKTVQACYNAGTAIEIDCYLQFIVHNLQSAQQGVFVEEVLLDTAQLAKIIVDIASDKKASDVLLLDVRDVTVIADYFVICSGSNSRQLQAIADYIDEELHKQGAHVLRCEGTPDSGWLLLDFGSVIVHIFGTREREYYHLERLWSNAKTVVYLQ
jgi:ribosome-associated protein